METSQQSAKTYTLSRVLGWGDGLVLLADGRSHGYADVNGGDREHAARELAKLAPAIARLEAEGYKRV
jgi:hypothetical protein